MVSEQPQQWMGGREGDAWAGCAKKRDGGEVESGGIDYVRYVYRVL